MNGHDEYGTMEIDRSLLLMAVILKLSPNEPVEITQADLEKLSTSFPIGPALSAAQYVLGGEVTVTLELVDAGEATRRAAEARLPRIR